MNGQGFDFEPRQTKHIETKHRRIVTPIPVPESKELIDEMQKYEPISNAGQPLIVWDHTEDGYAVCDPYGNKFIDFSSCVMITNAGHGNPEIIEAVGEQREVEGCLSIPGESARTIRPMSVKVKAQNRYGKWCFYSGSELKARAFCHEIDHLDGQLYIDHLAPEQEGE